MSPAWETARAQGNTHRTTHSAAGGRGGHRRAQGLTRPTGAVRMLSPAHPRAGLETRLWEAGAGALAQPPLTGAGSAAAAALRARALPEPDLACAAAPRRRWCRLLCSSGSNSGCHGQVQRGAHPRAARYEASVVSGTPGLGASQTQCVPLRGTPQPRCLPPPPQASRLQGNPLPLHLSSGHLSPGHPPLPPSPRPVRTLLSRRRPCRSSVQSPCAP